MEHTCTEITIFQVMTDLEPCIKGSTQPPEPKIVPIPEITTLLLEAETATLTETTIPQITPMPESELLTIFQDPELATLPENPPVALTVITTLRPDPETHMRTTILHLLAETLPQLKIALPHQMTDHEVGRRW